MAYSAQHSSRSFSRRIAQKWTRSESGATMIEFAIVFPIYLLFFFGIFEASMITFGNSMIENTLSQMAHKGMIGCERHEFTGNGCQSAFMVDGAAIKREIKQKTYGMVDSCNTGRFTLNIQPLQTYSYGDPGGGINLGQGDQLVVYYAYYEWPVLTPLLRIRKLFGDMVEFQYSTVVRNERFGNLGSSRIGANGGC